MSVSAEKLYGTILVTLRERNEYMIVSLLSSVRYTKLVGNTLILYLENTSNIDTLMEPKNKQKLVEILQNFGHFDIEFQQLSENGDNVVDKMKQKFNNIVINN